MKRKIRVGSRESTLALAQTNRVVDEIKKHHPELEFEIIGMKTRGDLILDKALDKIGGKGLFVKELENALLKNEIDFAVHSMKDMPAQMPDGLVIGAVSEREDPRDVLITFDGKELDQLPYQGVIGTSSARREVQILQKRPDLNIKILRGNVLTRIDKLTRHEFDAIVLASAGLKRLGYENESIRYFDVKAMIPAVGQGILGLECRKGDSVIEFLLSIHSEESSICLAAERAFMIKLNGGCSTPIAAHAILQQDRIKVCGLLASDDKKRVFRDCIEGRKDDATALGQILAENILSKMQ